MASRIAARIESVRPLPNATPESDLDGYGTVNPLKYLVGSNPLLHGDSWTISIQPAHHRCKFIPPAQPCR